MKENKIKKRDSIKKAKEIIRKNFLKGYLGIFSSRNTCGDKMDVLFCEDGISVEINYNYSYFEVFCDKDEDYEEIENYYHSLSVARDLSDLLATLEQYSKHSDTENIENPLKDFVEKLDNSVKDLKSEIKNFLEKEFDYNKRVKD